MINIPKQLQDKRFRFIKTNEDKSTNQKWKSGEDFKFNEPEFKEYLKTAKTYGVIGNNGLCIIDIDIKSSDTKELMNLYIQGKLPDTFTVKTPSGGMHLYYIIPELKQGYTFKSHNGEIRAANSGYVLGAASTSYTIEHDIPIKEITYAEISTVVEGLLENKDKFTTIKTDGLNWDITKIINMSDFEEMQNGEFQGTIEFLGESEGRKNILINTEKNTWKDFHGDGYGGDAVSLLAIKEKYITYKEYINNKNKLPSDIFIKTKNLGIEKYGFPEDKNYAESKKRKELLERYKVWTTDKNGNTKVWYQRLAELILREHGDCDKDFTLLVDKTMEKAVIVEFNDGIYTEYGKATIERLVDYYLEDFSSNNAVNEVLGKIKRALTAKYAVRGDFTPSPNFINLKNGVYDLETDIFTPKENMLGYNKFLTRLDTNYSKDALCPEFDKWLKRVFKTNNEHIQTILELIGYCCYRKYSIHKFFLFFGQGANGKTTLLNLMEAILGKDNCTNLDISSITKRTFDSSELYNKFINKVGEMKYDDLNDTDMLKKTVGEDTLSAQKKFKDIFNFRNFAKFIISTNTVAITRDKSDGFYRRVLIIDFKEQFTEDAILNMTDILKKEKEGILIKALAALQQLLKNEKFTNELSMEKNAAKYEGKLNFVEDWIRNNITESHLNETLTMNAIYDKYKKDCITLDMTATNKYDLEAAISRINNRKDDENLFMRKKRHHKRDRNKNQYYTTIFEGCDWKKPQKVDL